MERRVGDLQVRFLALHRMEKKKIQVCDHHGIQLPLCTGRTKDVDGVRDNKNENIQYIGVATELVDGTWRCLANVAGALCLVEVNITEVT